MGACQFTKADGKKTTTTAEMFYTQYRQENYDESRNGFYALLPVIVPTTTLQGRRATTILRCNYGTYDNDGELRRYYEVIMVPMTTRQENESTMYTQYRQDSYDQSRR